MKEKSLHNPQNTCITTKSILDDSLRRRAIEVVRFVGARLSVPETVDEFARSATNPYLLGQRWHPSSVACGFGSLVLPFIYLARSFDEPQWKAIAHRYAHLMAQGTQQRSITQPGLFGGTTGLASVVYTLYKEDQRYYNTWIQLHHSLCKQVLNREWRRHDKQGVADSDYDVIGGASGILAYLVTIENPDRVTMDVIQKLLEYLVWLSGLDEQTQQERWWIPTQFYALEAFRSLYPDGYLDCGVAHGVGGILGALTVAWRAGYNLPGQHHAIVSLSRWIVSHCVYDEWGINWPGKLPCMHTTKTPEGNSPTPTRAAWCYGAPGLARVLWLTGNVLQDDQLCQFAIEAIEAVFKRPMERRHTSSPTFCHGMAGLLTICVRFAQEIPRPSLKLYVTELVEHILDTFDPNLPFCFQNVEDGSIKINDPGWLTGSSGIILALLAASTNIASAWDSAFLVS